MYKMCPFVVLRLDCVMYARKVPDFEGLVFFSMDEKLKKIIMIRSLVTVVSQGTNDCTPSVVSNLCSSARTRIDGSNV
jgi:hypothetical protein